jgi:EmrB/QacA subfamily drug resistance transporter
MVPGTSRCVIFNPMSQKWWVLAGVGCSTFMATLDASIVNIALPTLTVELESHLDQVRWVVIIYLLALTCLILPFGKLSDIHGRKKVFTLGFVIFTIGSLLCGISLSITQLILARIVQAVGGAMLMANGPAIVTSDFPSKERGKGLGILAMIVSLGLISGPAVGGILIEHIGWRSIFLLNVPIGIVGIFLIYRFVQKDILSKSKKRFDWLGAALQTLLLLAFIALFDPPQLNFLKELPPLAFKAGLLSFLVVFTLLFLKIEAKTEQPLFDLSLVKIQPFWTANLAAFFMFVAFASVTVLMPFYLEEVQRLNTQQMGLYLTLIPIAILVSAPLSGRLSDKMGSRGLSLTGALIAAFSLLSFAGVFAFNFGTLGITAHSPPWVMSLSLLGLGLAMGLFQSPNNNAIMALVPTKKLGSASALLATVRNLGLVTGTGLATAIFSWREAQTQSFMEGFQSAHIVAALAAFAAALTCLAKKSGAFWNHPDFRANVSKENELEVQTKRT